MQDNLKDLGTEEVCHRTGSSVHGSVVPWHGEGGGRRIVVSRHVISSERTISRSDLIIGIRFAAARGWKGVAINVVVKVAVAVTVVVLSGHLPGYQRHE